MLETFRSKQFQCLLIENLEYVDIRALPLFLYLVWFVVLKDNTAMSEVIAQLILKYLNTYYLST